MERLRKENIKLAAMINYYWVSVDEDGKEIECRNKFTEEVAAKIEDIKGKPTYTCIYRESKPIQFSIFADIENNKRLIKELKKLLDEDFLPYPPQELLMDFHKWAGQTLTEVAAGLMLKPF